MSSLETRPTPIPADGRRRGFAIAACVLSALAVVWCIVTAFGVVDAARLTYYLPPPPGRAEPIVEHGRHEPILAFLILPALALVPALGAIVLGVVGLVRRRGARWWLLLLPVVAAVVATIGSALASLVELPVA